MEEPNAVSSDQPFITQQFLENILNEKVVKFHTSAGSKPGDNFMCIMTSLEITLQNQDKPLCLLLKTFPNHRTRQKILEDTNTHLKEYQMYSIYLSELIEFQKSVIGNDKILVPAMPEFVGGAAIDYFSDPSNYSELDPILSNYLLMVDVRKTYGFQMADKFKSLGYHHVKSVMEELAKYHALGYAYKVHNKLSSILDKFSFMDDRLLCNAQQRPQMVAMMNTGMQLVKEACKTFLKEKPEIAESLRKFDDCEIMGEYRAAFLNPKGMEEKRVEGFMRCKPSKFSGEPLEEQWPVPGHGDLWTNNILFKTGEDGNVSQCVFVDLQETRESCLMVDFTDFLYTSTDTAFRRKYAEEMVKIYFEKFREVCEILQVPPFPGFSLENMLRKFQRSKIFGFLHTFLLLPIVMVSPETNMDKVQFEGSGGEDWAEMFEKMGKTNRDENDLKLLRERFTEMMLELHEEGVL